MKTERLALAATMIEELHEADQRIVFGSLLIELLLRELQQREDTIAALRKESDGDRIHAAHLDATLRQLIGTTRALERAHIEARSELDLARQWGAELLVERDMLASDLGAAKASDERWAEATLTYHRSVIAAADAAARNSVADVARLVGADRSEPAHVTVIDDDGDPA